MPQQVVRFFTRLLLTSKGRGIFPRPFPLPFNERFTGVRTRPLQIALAFILTCCGYAGWFVGSTLGIVEVPKALLLGAALLVALVTLPLSGEWRLPAPGDDLVGLVLAGVGGMTALWAAPYLLLLQRSSDAPSGTETLFFGAVAWGLIMVLAALLTRAWRPSVTAPAAALCAVVGAAALLGNWERPSSFSPLVKFPVREGWMLAAGILFAAGTLLVLYAATRVGPKKAHTLAFATAATVGILAGLPAILGVLPRLSFLAGTLILATVSYAAFAYSWFVLADEVGPARGAAALMLVPTVLTALTIVERTTGARGADPIVWAGASAGIAASIAGSVALLCALPGPADPEAEDGRRSPIGLAAVISGSLAVAASVAALALPAISATVTGALASGDTYRAAWSQPGAQSAAAWAVAAAAALALAAALSARAERTFVWASSLGAAIIASLTYVALTHTSFATWNNFVPAEIQQAYGTEYALLVFRPLQSPAALASIALAAVAAILVLVEYLSRTSSRRRIRNQEKS